MLGSVQKTIVGPLALTCILTKLAVDNAHPASMQDVERLSIACALLVGVEQFLMGLFRVGVVVDYISKPVLSAFTTAAGVIIANSQLLALFGLQCVKDNSCEKHSRSNIADNVATQATDHHHQTTFEEFISFLKHIKYTHIVRLFSDDLRIFESLKFSFYNFFEKKNEKKLF